MKYAEYFLEGQNRERACKFMCTLFLCCNYIPPLVPSEVVRALRNLTTLTIYCSIIICKDGAKADKNKSIESKKIRFHMKISWAAIWPVPNRSP